MRSIDDIKDGVCCDQGFVNYQDFQSKSLRGELSEFEFSKVINEIAFRWGRHVEQFYKDDPF